MAHTSLLFGKVQLAAVIFLAGLLTSSAALAQGFIKTYDSPWPSNGTDYHASNYQIFENQNGYTIFGDVFTNYSPDSLRYLSVRRTDLKGAETQATVFIEIVAPLNGFSDGNELGVVSGAIVDLSLIHI